MMIPLAFISSIVREPERRNNKSVRIMYMHWSICNTEFSFVFSQTACRGYSAHWIFIRTGVSIPKTRRIHLQWYCNVLLTSLTNTICIDLLHSTSNKCRNGVLSRYCYIYQGCCPRDTGLGMAIECRHYL